MENITFGAQRLVHLDLKGAPPKLQFFEMFFPFIKEIGATGVLLEWEDTFPYTRELIQVGGLSNSAQVSGAPYTLEEAKQLINLATDSDLKVIPLVQTFGHMEFILKHEQWRCLREVEAYPSSMCPTNGGSMPLIRSIIKQIVAFHSNMQYIHIGGDEIWHMGLCPNCQKRVQSCKNGKAGLYLDHVTEVAQYIKDNYPSLKVIIWDDMLRNIEVNVLQNYYMGNLVEPMVWHYNASDTFQLGGALWEKYGNIFANVWGATAFKGATSSCQLVPVARYHVSNHEAWLGELGSHAGRVPNFRGVALTGWSRFDHFATLCELLPCGLPSLCLCLKTWLSGGYSQGIHDSVGKLLGYSDDVPFPGLDHPVSRYSFPSPQLTFPGWEVFVSVESLVSVKTRYRNVVNSDQIQTWLNPWQVANNYTNPMQIDTILPVIAEILVELTAVEQNLKSHLEKYFFSHTLEELIGTHVNPIKQHLKQLKSDCETQLLMGCRVRGHKRVPL